MQDKIDNFMQKSLVIVIEKFNISELNNHQSTG